MGGGIGKCETLKATILLQVRWASKIHLACFASCDLFTAEIASEMQSQSCHGKGDVKP